MTTLLRMLCLAVAVTATPVLAIDEYRLDDGVKEMGVGIQSGGSNSLAWLNRFVIEPGLETITAVRIAFGGSLAAANLPNGSPITVYVWNDPNQNGDPADATVLASVPGTVSGAGTNAFATFTLPTPVTLPVGHTFFAGAVANYSGQVLVGALDRDGTDDVISYPPALHSFIAGSGNGVPVDPNALNLAQLPVTTVSQGLFGGTDDGNLMIRLNALVVGSPELEVDPDLVDFGDIDIGATSPTMLVTLRSIGTAPLGILSIGSPSPPFHIAPGGTCPGVLPVLMPPGDECTLAYVFAPDTHGPLAASLIIDSNDPASPHTLTLFGNGTIFEHGFE